MRISNGRKNDTFAIKKSIFNQSKPKGLNRIAKNRLGSPMPEGGQPQF
jgi:hypothetical protein